MPQKDLPVATKTAIKDKIVLLRLDLDLPFKDGQLTDLARLKAVLPTLRLCLKEAKKTLILGHLGRPQGREESLSLKPVKTALERLLSQDILLFDNFHAVGEWGSGSTSLGMLENLRFFPGETNNDPDFAISLAKLGQIYINEAYATSHREVASIVGLPKHLPSYLGLYFYREITALDPIIDNPKRPIILILGGAKPDKLEFVDNFLSRFDNVLLGGTLVHEISDRSNLIKATLSSDGKDITKESAQHFSRIIANAATIVWNGPVGKFEEQDAREGTRIVAQAIASSSAYKLAGGGDTLAAIKQLDLTEKFDHLSTGGGALLYYLAHHTLPGIEALKASPAFQAPS